MMNQRSIQPVVQIRRSIAWLRIRMMVVMLLRLLSLVLGCCLVLFAALALAGVVVSGLFGDVHFGNVTITAPAVTLDGFRIDPGTGWGACVLIVFHGFILAWGIDFVRMGLRARSGCP